MPNLVKTERNKKIYEMYKAGYTKAEIARTFGISRPMVSQVIDREKPHDCDLYRAIARTVAERGYNPTLDSRTFTQLYRRGIKTVDDLIRTFSEEQTTHEFVENAWGLGPASYEIICDVVRDIRKDFNEGR